MTLQNALRFSAAALLAPALTTLLATAGFFASLGAPIDFEEARMMATFGLTIGYFVELLNFLPLFVLARRLRAMSFLLAAALGATAGWLAPLSYMLLMTVWRGEALNVFVLRASGAVLSPWLAVFGALGGLIFWFLARGAGTAPNGARRSQRPALLAPVNGLSGS